MKVVVFGGGSFGTALSNVLALHEKNLDIVLLVRDHVLAEDINDLHCNTRYLREYMLPGNIRSTTNANEAIHGAQFAVHAVPVQSSRSFLKSIKDILPTNLPIVCVSKGIEAETGMMMSEVITTSLCRKHPTAFISGPSFAREVMDRRPTVVVIASKDVDISQSFQNLLSCEYIRVSTTLDVIGVEITGALKNVIAIAAGISDGMNLGHNALAALVAQGCVEIRWLASKMGAKSVTLSGVSGLGDIMLTCYVNLSRNRNIGRRLGAGETLPEILQSSVQVVEGVSTADSVMKMAAKYKVKPPVLTAVSQIIKGRLKPQKALSDLMNLPRIEES
jgi:glycerol-3-phosphate dehydrogenase (NAD+)